MFVSRGMFYWLLFVTFGVIAILVGFVQSLPWCTDYLWLFFTGLGGILTNSDTLTSWSRAYDVLVGIFFLVIGCLGILHNLDINLVNNSSFISGANLNSDNILGLSVALTFSLIHVTLGFYAFKFGVRNPALSSDFEVRTSEKDK